MVSGINRSSLQLVEMCSEGVWSPVCDHNWTVADATVVCRELGYHHLGMDIYYYHVNAVFLVWQCCRMC